jgi:hypothetical protein
MVTMGVVFSISVKHHSLYGAMVLRSGAAMNVLKRRVCASALPLGAGGMSVSTIPMNVSSVFQ